MPPIATSAHAGTIETLLEGVITEASAGNPFGLSVGDEYYLTAIDDPTTRTEFNGYDTVLRFNTDYLDTNSLSLTFFPSNSDPFTFIAAGVDVMTHPLIFFDEGEYVGFRWEFPFTYNNTQYRFLASEDLASDLMVRIGPSSGAWSDWLAAGNIQPVEYSTHPIPEPSSALLFAVGSLVVGGALRRKVR